MHRQIFEEEHDAFRQTVRSFVEREILPDRDEHVRAGRLPSSLWKRAGELGLLGLCIPEVYGGAGIDDFRFNAVMDEELTRAGLAYACALGVHTHVIAPYLVHLATAEQRERWLPGFCDGSLISAIAMTEPSGGSDVRSMRTTARLREDGWLLSGSKTFITNGSTAGLVIVAAQAVIDGEARGISLFVVETPTTGFSAGPPLHKVGQAEGDTAELFFDDVLVPEAHLLGEVGAGFKHLMTHLAQERLASAVCNVAHARKVLDNTVRYVSAREAFGGPLTALQHIRFVLADLATEVASAQALVDECLRAHMVGRLSPIDAAMAKLKSSEVQSVVVDAGVQLHGGMGYMRESEVARDWMDARVTRIWAGTNEVMREVIGRAAVR